MKAIGLLVCFLFVLATFTNAQKDSSTIHLDVFTGSNSWFFALAIIDASVDTSAVQLQQASSSTWESLTYIPGWGYYTLSSGEELSFPLSIRINSADGHQITFPNIIESLSAGTVDTGVQFTSATSPVTEKLFQTRKNKHTAEPTPAPSRHHTSAPTTSKHTSAPTTSKHTSAPTTSKHTSAPATSAPTTSKHTSSPATSPPATSPPSHTSAPSGGGSSGMKLMVPLYVDPGSAWNAVIASAHLVPTIAIINPDSGPGSKIESTYSTNIPLLAAAGVTVVGYVHSSYGARAIADVKADIDIYATQYPHLSGIFVDEVATTTSELSYYEELYSYIMSMPGWTVDIINPGTVPASGYANAATIIVTYEDVTSGFANSANPSWATAANKAEFAMITYSGTSSSMETALSAAKSKGYYGWVYVTDQSESGNTYGSLPSFYAAEAAYVASLNA